MAGTGKRQANFELLRILAMLMVVSMHFLFHTGGLPAAEAGRMPDGRETAGVVVESFCIVAVNVYVLISGYFLSQKGFSFRRLLRLECQVLFYTLLIPVGLTAAGALSASELWNPYHLWNCLFPVQSGHYWFVTAYVVLLLFSPFLNAAVRAMSARQLRIAIGTLLIFFCLGKSLSVLPFASDRYGYDFGWFICLYLTGACMRRHGSALLGRKRRCALLYASSCLLTAGIELAGLWLCAGRGILEYYASVPFHYNYVFAYTGALGLFGLFSGLRIPEGKVSERICRISQAVLGVYLIHEQADISGRWTAWISGEPSCHTAGYLIQMTESVLFLFLLCICIDLLRGRLFALAGRGLLKTRPGQRAASFLAGLDSRMEQR